MISVNITRGQFCFSNGSTSEAVTIDPKDRNYLVNFFLSLIAGGWDGHMQFASSMNWPEEDGWRLDMPPRELLSNCVREAAQIHAPAEAAPRTDDAALLRSLLNAALVDRDTLARELAELEHEHEQVCSALVVLQDERNTLRDRLRTALAHEGERVPLDDGEPLAETMVAETEEALAAGLEEPPLNHVIELDDDESAAALAEMLEDPPAPSPALVALMQDDTDDAVADYMNAKKEEAAPEPTKRKKGRK